MPGSLAEIAVEGGISQLKCPITGIPVIVQDEGFEPEGHHSPHLRFFIDWSSEIWFVDPADLPPNQASYQESLLEIFRNDEGFGSQNAMVEECLKVLPDSVLVLEILDPPTGSFLGDICYACFDFGAPALTPAAKLHLLQFTED